MDEVYVELDEVKAELEKLRADYKSKSALSDNLRKAYNEQLTKAQESSLKIVKLAQEINENAEKISAAQHMCEDLKYSLKDKESVLQHLRAANEKLRIDSDEKCRKLEETNRVLALALDEANEKKMEEEQAIQAYKEEIRGLQGRLSDSQKKCLEAERKANASKELRERDVVILRVEEENRKVLDELKWKKEQFQHLEEAHEKLRDEFKETQKEWERERSSLLDEICSLQTSLDSQTRVSDNFQKRLQMCNQALAHEESRRKRLEVQVSEFQTSAFSENEDARSQLECLTAERDKELASLRQSLSSKAALQKEMEYQSEKLQQENEELRMSLKELQEAQIQSAPGSPSLAKLRNKLRRVEQMHKDSLADHRAKEAEWSSQLENMTGDLNYCKSELESKDAAINGLRIELEQMQRDFTSDLRAKEYECNSQLERMRAELTICQSDLVSKDAALKDLNMEMEQMRGCTTNGVEDAEWSSQLQKMAGDVKSYISDVQRKDATITELKMEMEQMHRDRSTTFQAKESEWSLQLEKLAGDVKSYISEIENKDATIIELKMEMEQMNKECATYRTNETEWRSQIEKMMPDVKNYISELEKKDATMNQLKMEMEQIHKECATYRTKETEWSSQLDKITCDMKSELEKKDATINQLKMGIDEMHRDCSAYQAKETEWSSQLDKMTGELVCKEAVIYELKMELETSHSLSVQLKLQNEELSAMLLVLKHEMSEAQLKIANEKSKMVLFEKEKEEYISQLRHQLEMKNADLVMAQKCIEEEREKAALLNKRIDALDFIEIEQLQMQKELARYKGMVEDSSEQQHRLKQQVLQIESVLERERRELDDALERANTELAEKISVVSEIEIELHIRKSITENLRVDLEASLGMRKELEASLIAEVDIGETIKQENNGLLRILEEKEKTVENIHEQIVLMEQKLKLIDAENAGSAKREAAMSLEVGRLEQELLMRDLTGVMLAEIGAERSEQEKQKRIQLVEEKYQRLNHLMQRVASLEHKFSCSLVSLSSELNEKQAEIDLIQEAWEKNSSAESSAGLENEEKKFVIAQLEKEICTLQTQLELQQKSLCDSQQRAMEVEAELKMSFSCHQKVSISSVVKTNNLQLCWKKWFFLLTIKVPE